MGSKNKIVLSGYYGFDNIGDEAVLYAIITALKQIKSDVEITVLSNNPQKTAAVYGVASVNRWKIKEVIKAIKESTMLISGGGSLLQDVTSNKNIPYYLGIVKIANFYKKPVVFYSQGIGPVNKPFNQKLLKWASKKVSHIFVREEASKATLENMNVKVPITVAIDPVIGIELDETLRAQLKKTMTGKMNIGIYIRPWDDDARLLENLATAIRPLIDKGYQFYAIPMYFKQDLEIAQKLSEKLNHKIKVIDTPLTIEETVAYTSAFDMIVGMRLHSLIMAAAVATPMIALSYDPKVKDFSKTIKNPYCFDVDKFTDEVLLEAMKTLIIDHENEHGRLLALQEDCREKAYLPATYIKQLLK